jgi:hypothetical protein
VTTRWCAYAPCRKPFRALTVRRLYCSQRCRVAQSRSTPLPVKARFRRSELAHMAADISAAEIERRFALAKERIRRRRLEAQIDGEAR